MGTSGTCENIIKLMTTFDVEIDSPPDELKCTECKSVLKDAHQLPCGCQLCRACMDDVMARGTQTCPGDSQECGATPLSSARQDYRANRRISKLTARCPQPGCSHECALANMEAHLRECRRNRIACPFHKFGCQGDKLGAGEMQECGTHSEMLIEMVANNISGVDALKRDHEAGKTEMETVKRELALRDEQMRAIMDEMRHVQNENKSMKDENKSMKDENKSMKDENKSMKDENKSMKDENKVIKREREVLADRVRQLAEKLDWEIEERRKCHELFSAKLVTTASESNEEPVKSDIQSIIRDLQAMKSEVASMKSQVRAPAVPAGLERADAICDDWVIDAALGKISWSMGSSGQSGRSDIFKGKALPCTFQMESQNILSENKQYSMLIIELQILAGPSDPQMKWPIKAAATVTVFNKGSREGYCRYKQRFEIACPPERGYKCICSFAFYHYGFEAAGVDMNHSVRVTCHIVPDVGQ